MIGLLDLLRRVDVHDRGQGSAGGFTIGARGALVAIGLGAGFLQRDNGGLGR